MAGARATLERRYRRLLASYPQPFRAQHEDELVAVLLEGARDDQRRPRPGETVDLVVHGLLARVRTRRLAGAVFVAPERTPAYGDALAASLVHGLGPAPVGTWTFPRWIRWVAAASAVAAVAGLIGVVGARLLGLDTVDALAGRRGSGSASGAVGQRVYHGLALRPAGDTARAITVDLHSITPRITVNTAGATVTVLICTGEQSRAGALVYGGTSPDAGQACTRLVPFHRGTLRVGMSANAQLSSGLVVAVTPHRPGIVRIEGADVSYTKGDRPGRQHVGPDWTLHVS